MAKNKNKKMSRGEADRTVLKFAKRMSRLARKRGLPVPLQVADWLNARIYSPSRAMVRSGATFAEGFTDGVCKTIG